MHSYDSLAQYTLAVFSSIRDRSVVIVSTRQDTAWSSLVDLHFSTGGLVWSGLACKLGMTLLAVATVHE